MRQEVGDKLHVWPFDGWAIPEGRSVVAEAYPSIFRNRYDKGDRTADQQDAYSTARWLTEMDQRGFLTRYFDPPLTDEERNQCDLEGWILGAERLRVSPQCVYQLVETGRIVAHRIGVGRGTIRISGDDLDAYLESCRVEKESYRQTRKNRKGSKDWF